MIMMIARRKNIHCITLFTTITIALSLSLSLPLISCQSPFESQCVSLPVTSVCRPLLSYNHSLTSSTSPCLDEKESNVQSLSTLVATLNAANATTCGQYLSTILCQTTYMPCQQQGTTTNTTETHTFPSFSLCMSLLRVCPEPLPTIIQKSNPALTPLFDCTSQVYSQNHTSNNPQITLTNGAIKIPTCQMLKSTSMCYGLTSPSIYLSAGMTQDMIEASLRSKRQLIAQLPVLTGCRDSFVRTMCNKAYPRCESVLGAPFPSLVCQSQCNETKTACTSFMQVLDNRVTIASSPPSPTMTRTLTELRTFLDCTAAHTINPIITTSSHEIPQCRNRILIQGLQDYPVNTTFFSTNNPSLYTQCNLPSKDVPIIPQTVALCPAPLVYPDNPHAEGVIAGGSCATPCATLLYTRDEWRASDRLMKALIIISFILCSFMFATWITFPSKRKQHLLVWFNVCLWIISFTMLWSIPVSKNDLSQMGCKDNTDVAHQTDQSYCTFQSFIIWFVVQSLVWWWTFIALDLYLKIVLQKKITKEQGRRMLVVFHCLAWGVPLLFTIIAAGAGVFGRNAASPWCFAISNARNYDWGTIYFPVGILIGIGSFMMASIIFVMVKSTNASQQQGSRRRPGWWHRYIRPSLFIFIFAFIFAFTVGFRALIYFGESEFRASATEFVTCLMTSPDPALCGEHPKNRPNLGLFYLFQFVIAGQGILNFLLYGTQKRNILLWYYWLTCKGFDSKMPADDNNRVDTSSLGKPSPYDTGSPPQTARSTTKKNHTTSNNGSGYAAQGNTPAPLERTVSNTNVQMTTPIGPAHGHGTTSSTSIIMGSDHRIMPTHNAHQLSTGTNVLQVEWGSNPHENEDTELGVNIPARRSFAPASRPSQPAPARMSAFASTPVHNPTTGEYDQI